MSARAVGSPWPTRETARFGFQGRMAPRGVSGSVVDVSPDPVSDDPRPQRNPLIILVLLE
jgi:hypothetical protein